MEALTRYERVFDKSICELRENVHDSGCPLLLLLESIPLLSAIQDQLLHEAFGQSDQDSVEKCSFNFVV